MFKFVWKHSEPIGDQPLQELEDLKQAIVERKAILKAWLDGALVIPLGGCKWVNPSHWRGISKVNPLD